MLAVFYNYEWHTITSAIDGKPWAYHEIKYFSLSTDKCNIFFSCSFVISSIFYSSFQKLTKTRWQKQDDKKISKIYLSIIVHYLYDNKLRFLFFISPKVFIISSWTCCAVDMKWIAWSVRPLSSTWRAETKIFWRLIFNLSASSSKSLILKKINDLYQKTMI